MKQFGGLLLALACLSGCASSIYFAQHSPNSREAVVYVIREHAEPIAWNMNIFVDEQKAASVANKSFVKFSVPAGRHKFGFDWPILAGSPTVRANIDIAGGQTRYFVVSGESRVSGFYVVVILTKQSTHVYEVSEADAQKILRRIRK